MYDHLALKRLTASDLTFFERMFRRLGAGNQKSINLNADVLTGEFYPDLGSVADLQPGGEIGLSLTIWGPGAAPAYRLKRKILKGLAYKNWRLNGEFVHDPVAEPGRFDDLRPGDLALMGFQGRLAPHGLGLCLVAAGTAEDANIHAALLPFVGVAGRPSMVSLRPQALSEALAGAGVPDGHPLQGFATDIGTVQALEDAARGGASGIEALRARRRIVSRDELAKARLSADRTGLYGEELVDAWLSSRPGTEHEWVAAADALSPFDFLVHDADGEIAVDVKSTGGLFERAFHMSIAEVAEAAGGRRPYVIYRVHALTASGGAMRVSGDVRDLARRLLDAHDRAVFGGIRADAFTVPVEALSWGAEVTLSVRGDEEEDQTSAA